MTRANGQEMASLAERAMQLPWSPGQCLSLLGRFLLRAVKRDGKVRGGVDDLSSSGNLPVQHFSSSLIK